MDKDNLVDFVDILLAHLEEAEPENVLTMDQILFELEDFLGGHSAVSNLVGRAIVEIASVDGLSSKIYEQVRSHNLTHSKQVPYPCIISFALSPRGKNDPKRANWLNIAFLEGVSSMFVYKQ